MAAIRVETWIAARPERCFDLARDMRVHAETMAASRERIVSEAKLLELGDTVTFEAVHFGRRQRLTARITAYDRPRIFTDEMIEGAFRSLVHDHLFEPKNGGTLMIDEVRFRAPLGPLGQVAEVLFLATYMRRLLVARGQQLKDMAEAPVTLDAHDPA
jgi:ligand-binding SRPBCC domain-containing protein